MKKKVKITQEKEIEFKYLRANIGARYWGDAKVNDIVDEDGTLIPLRVGDYWCIKIDIDEGIILDWPKGTKADIHYKCCDNGEYYLIDVDGVEYEYKQNYVPKILDIYDDSFGDYVIMKVDGEGRIRDWKKHPNIYDFFNNEED